MLRPFVLVAVCAAGSAALAYDQGFWQDQSAREQAEYYGNLNDERHRARMTAGYEALSDSMNRSAAERVSRERWEWAPGVGLLVAVVLTVVFVNRSESKRRKREATSAYRSPTIDP